MIVVVVVVVGVFEAKNLSAWGRDDRSGAVDPHVMVGEEEVEVKR